jgi:hypothetical protein
MNNAEREQHLFDLAERLGFSAEKHGACFSLVYKGADAKPFREENLSLEQAEDILRTWKLRGPHGG